MEKYNNLVGRVFVETVGYHKGERFECTGIHQDRDGVFMSGFWACGSYTFEPVGGSLVEVAG